jgi:hypothetical protein
MRVAQQLSRNYYTAYEDPNSGAGSVAFGEVREAAAFMVYEVGTE